MAVIKIEALKPGFSETKTIASISNLSFSHFLDRFRVTSMSFMTFLIHPDEKFNLLSFLDVYCHI